MNITVFCRLKKSTRSWTKLLRISLFSVLASHLSNVVVLRTWWTCCVPLKSNSTEGQTVRPWITKCQHCWEELSLVSQSFATISMNKQSESSVLRVTHHPPTTQSLADLLTEKARTQKESSRIIHHTYSGSPVDITEGDRDSFQTTDIVREALTRFIVAQQAGLSKSSDHCMPVWLGVHIHYETQFPLFVFEKVRLADNKRPLNQTALVKDVLFKNEQDWSQPSPQDSHSRASGMSCSLRMLLLFLEELTWAHWEDMTMTLKCLVLWENVEWLLAVFSSWTDILTGWNIFTLHAEIDLQFDVGEHLDVMLNSMLLNKNFEEMSFQTMQVFLVFITIKEWCWT